MHLEGNINSSSIHVFWYNMYRIEVNSISMNGTGHFVLLSYDFQLSLKQNKERSKDHRRSSKRSMSIR